MSPAATAMAWHVASAKDGVSGIKQAAPIPFEGQIGIPEASDDKFELTITVNVDDCNSIADSSNIVVDKVVTRNKHRNYNHLVDVLTL
jgi:hypothetical protein